MPVGFNYSNLFSHHLISYWRYSQAHQSNLFYSFHFSYMKNSKYEYFKHPARYVNQFTEVKGWVWVMGDVKEIVHNHRGSLQQRNLALDHSQPRLGNYALVDLPNPVFPFSGVSNNLSLTSWLKFFFLILQYFSLYAKALCCLFRNFECKINLFHFCLLRVFSHVCSEASQMSRETLFTIFRSLPPWIHQRQYQLCVY